MAAPNWFVKLLIALGLKKDSEAVRAENIRKLNERRSELFKTIEGQELQAKILEKKTDARSRSDLSLLRRQIADNYNALAVLNKAIQGEMAIKSGDTIGELGETLSSQQYDLHQANVQKETAAAAVEMTQEVLEEGNAIRIEDSTLTETAPAAAQTETAAAQNEQKNDRTVSENTSLNV
jgi:hypothetical protein